MLTQNNDNGTICPGRRGKVDRDSLARQGVVCCRGSGYRGDPFVYWLPGREPLLWPGDRAGEEEKQAWRDRCTERYRRLSEQPPSA